MTSLFLFEKLGANQKKLAIFLLGIFVVANSILSFFHRHYFLSLVLILVGICLIVFSLLIFKGTRIKQIDKEFIFDLFIYAVMVIYIILIFRNYSIKDGSIINSVIFERIEHTKYTFLMLIFLIATSIISIHNPTIPSKKIRKLRQVDYYKNIPYGFRRTLVSLIVFPLFWVLGITILNKTVNPFLLSLEIVLGAGLSILCFEIVSGYNSQILRLFGGGLGLYIIISIFFQYENIISFLKSINLLPAVFGTLFGVPIYASMHAINRLQGMKDNIRVIEEQKPTHTIIIIILALGCIFTFVYWMILPLFELFEKT